jgi:hypothetical protein
MWWLNRPGGKCDTTFLEGIQSVFRGLGDAGDWIMGTFRTGIGRITGLRTRQTRQKRKTQPSGSSPRKRRRNAEGRFV